MKFAAKSLLFLMSLAATFAYSQNNNIQQVQHVIVVIQENRTPTNLFHEDATLVANGAHVIPPGNKGPCGLPAMGRCASVTSGSVPLTGLPLDTPVDPDHSHYPGWYCTYHGGLMDGACHVKVNQAPGSDISGCPLGGKLQYCPYTYVDNTSLNCTPLPCPGILDPYFHIAEQYGFANWMFQTHQGPSQEAHLFLFSGTSAPDYFNDPNSNCPQTDPSCWQWFAAENPVNAAAAGCVAPANTVALELPPATAGNQNPAEQPGYAPQGAPPGYPCYNHPTLVDLLTPAKITWRYYAGNTSGSNQSYAIWRAPDMILNICQPTPSNLPGEICSYSGYTNNVYTGNPAQVLNDLGAASCNLQQVSWVIPDGIWSDHPGTGSFDGGPSWVAAIVNAVGNSTNFGAKLRSTPCTDTIKGQQVPYWQDTVVLVVWDDWGGFYDDILPWGCGPNGVCNGYPNTTAQEYVYGFRVPLLVVGAYVNQVTPQGGYISGACPGGNCQNQEKPPYVHDFGSILNFIEYAFGTGGNPLGGTGGISPHYLYADTLAPDAPLTCGSKCPGPYSLSDFFNFNQTPRPFALIKGAKYDTGVFLNPTAYFPNYPADPDDDAIDPQ